MSTPRTDEQAVGHIGFYSCATVPASFARELEIETQQLQAERDALREALNGLLEVTSCRVASGLLAIKSPTMLNNSTPCDCCDCVAARAALAALALSQPKP